MPTNFLTPKNNANSLLSATITAIATTLSVTAGEGALFPSSNFPITIDNEIMLCSTRTADTLTVTRAQEGTTGAIHTAGATVRLNITAKYLSDLNTAVNALETTPPVHVATHAIGGADPLPVTTLYYLKKAGRHITVPVCSGWTATLTGTGTVTQFPMVIYSFSGATTLSSAIANVPLIFGLGASNHFINWNESLYLFLPSFIVQHLDPTNEITRIQFRQKSTLTLDDLAERGFGIEISGASLRLFVETHNGATRTELDTAFDMTTGLAVKLEILFVAATGVYVYIDGVLRGTILTTIPTGTGAASKFGASWIRNGGAAANLYDGFYTAPWEIYSTRA